MHDVPNPTATAHLFCTSIYRLSAIKKAAYRFSGQFHVQIEMADIDLVKVVLTPVGTLRPGGLDPASFPTEVLDQELREVVATETAAIRNVILAQALSGLPLTDPLGEGSAYRDDPLDIARRSGNEPTRSTPAP